MGDRGPDRNRTGAHGANIGRERTGAGGGAVGNRRVRSRHGDRNPPAPGYNRARHRRGSGGDTVFENLTSRLGTTLDRLRGRGRLTDDNIREALREVRTALLEADVALPVVREFTERVRERAVGQGRAREPYPGPGAGPRGPRRADRADGREQRPDSCSTCSRRRWCWSPASRVRARPRPSRSSPAGSSSRPARA